MKEKQKEKQKEKENGEKERRRKGEGEGEKEKGRRRMGEGEGEWKRKRRLGRRRRGGTRGRSTRWEAEEGGARAVLVPPNRSIAPPCFVFASQPRPARLPLKCKLADALIWLCFFFYWSIFGTQNANLSMNGEQRPAALL